MAFAGTVRGSAARAGGSREDSAASSSVDGADRRARAELTALFRVHLGQLTRFLRGLGVRDADLDDVLQETFAVAWRRRDCLRSDASPLGWLLAIARRTASSQRRRRDYRESKFEVSVDEAALPGCRSDEGRVRARELASRVEDFLGSLDEVHREVFLLSMVEGASAVEIAAATEANVNTVYSRVRKVRRAFREFSRSEGLELP